MWFGTPQIETIINLIANFSHPQGTFILDTDALNFAMGLTLSQQQQRKRKSSHITADAAIKPKKITE